MGWYTGHAARVIAAMVIMLSGGLANAAMERGVASAGIDYRSAWSCDQKKFNWYCDEDPAPPAQQKQDADKKKDGDKTRSPLTEEEKALEEIKRIKDELEGKKALAIIKPTPENLKAYLEAQQRMLRMSSVFSDVWMRTIWQTPELNYELKRPVNNAAIALYKQERNKKRLDVLASLAKEWGVFFFFRSDCPYCHLMSRTLNLLTERYGMTVFPVSLDGGALPEYPSPRPDNGMAATLGVTVTPTMVLGNVKTRQMVMLGTGVVSLDDLIDRIFVLTSTKPGDLY